MAETTSRGFAIEHFTDQYGLECSVQISSLATERCVWVGIDNPTVSWFPGNNTGWHPVELPPVTNIDSRMHLTQEQAGWLAHRLQHFAETGELP